MRNACFILSRLRGGRVRSLAASQCLATRHLDVRKAQLCEDLLEGFGVGFESKPEGLDERGERVDRQRRLGERLGPLRGDPEMEYRKLLKLHDELSDDGLDWRGRETGQHLPHLFRVDLVLSTGRTPEIVGIAKTP